MSTDLSNDGRKEFYLNVSFRVPCVMHFENKRRLWRAFHCLSMEEDYSGAGGTEEAAVDDLIDSFFRLVQDLILQQDMDKYIRIEKVTDECI